LINWCGDDAVWAKPSYVGGQIIPLLDFILLALVCFIGLLWSRFIS